MMVSALLALATAALGAPVLELPEEADGALVSAAVLSGFALGDCTDGPCARWEADGIVVIHGEGRSSVVAVSPGEPERSLALVLSRLALGPDPERAGVRAPEVVGAVGGLAPVTWSPSVAVLGERNLEVRLAPKAEPTAQVRPEVATDRLRLRTSIGGARAPVLAALVGRSRGPVGWVAGVRLDGSVAGELGVSGRLGSGRLWLQGLAVVGPEGTPGQCLVCSVDEQEAEDGSVVEVRRGLFVEGTGGAWAWGPLARVEAGPVWQVARGVGIQPHGGAVVSGRGPRFELGIGLIWQRG